LTLQPVSNDTVEIPIRITSNLRGNFIKFGYLILVRFRNKLKI
jgi:hypothetical protein